MMSGQKTNAKSGVGAGNEHNEVSGSRETTVEKISNPGYWPEPEAPEELVLLPPQPEPAPQVEPQPFWVVEVDVEVELPEVRALLTTIFPAGLGSIFSFEQEEMHAANTITPSAELSKRLFMV